MILLCRKFRIVFLISCIGLSFIFAVFINKFQLMIEAQNRYQAILDILDYEEAVEKYKKINGVYPENSEGIAVLFQDKVITWPKTGYFRGMKKEKKDPWENYYVYKRRFKLPYLIYSLGKDGQESLDDLYMPIAKINRIEVSYALDGIQKNFFQIKVFLGIIVLLLLMSFILTIFPEKR